MTDWTPSPGDIVAIAQVIASVDRSGETPQYKIEDIPLGRFAPWTSVAHRAALDALVFIADRIDSVEEGVTTEAAITLVDKLRMLDDMEELFDEFRDALAAVRSIRSQEEKES